MQNTKMGNALHWLPLNSLYLKMGYKKRYKAIMWETHLSFKLQHQHARSLHSSPDMSFGNDEENLFHNQCPF